MKEENTPPATQKPPLPKHAESLRENMLQALRTTGALLVGNSALIAAGVLGKDPFMAILMVVLGAIAIFYGSFMVPSVRRGYKDAKIAKAAQAAQQQKNGVKLPDQQSKGDE